MSSTSSSRVRNGARCSRSSRSSASCLRDRAVRGVVGERVGDRLVLGLGDEHLAVRPVPRRDLMAPPELARDAPRLDVLHPVEIGLLPVLRHELGLARRAPRRSPARASVLALTYHWSVRNGSITTLERSPCGTMCVCGSILSSRPVASSRSTIVLRASKRSTPCSAIVSSRSADGRHAVEERLVVLAASSLRLDVEHVDQRQVVPLADLEIVEVVRRRDLHRAGALLRIGVFVADDRDAAADQRQDRVSCRSGACSARSPDAPRPRCRPASSPAAWSRR